MQQPTLITLKFTLQQYGALSPEAWQQILSLSKQVKLLKDQNLKLHDGQLSYIQTGILKEQDFHERQTPTILNFHYQNQFLITRKFQLNHQFTAINTSTIIYWDISDLLVLYFEFKELSTLYNNLYAQFDKHSHFRSLLIEMNYKERIQEFKQHYAPIIPYLKRKEMANFLHLNYFNFLKYWNKTL
ncbi:MAG: hypothetical protein EOO99_10175 [Pedobacter sp.]|nr:MAG: hypothetical protein EOO99_10175 [Pedobacter sp.]